MVKVSRAALWAAALLLAACNSLSSENESQLALYLENAAQYYDGGHYERAFQQWDQALLLDSANEKARLGQAMSLYQMGRVESPEAIQPLAEGTKRLDALRLEDFGADQWKVDLGAGLAHERWCEIYDRKLRKIKEDERRGVTPDAKTVEISKSEFAMHMRVAQRAFESVLEGSEKDPRDRLTCWLGLARIAAWRDDLEASLGYAKLYLEQVLRSKKLWEEAKVQFPREAPVWEAKRTGAEIQEAELRDLMGAVYYKLGRMKEAEEQVDIVLKTYPQRATAYLNRGILRQGRGEDDLARSDFRKFLSYTELPDGDPSILECTRRLGEVESRLKAQEAIDRGEAPPAPEQPVPPPDQPAPPK